jgi:hypothetical protein
MGRRAPRGGARRGGVVTLRWRCARVILFIEQNRAATLFCALNTATATVFGRRVYTYALGRVSYLQPTPQHR